MNPSKRELLRTFFWAGIVFCLLTALIIHFASVTSFTLDDWILAVGGGTFFLTVIIWWLKAGNAPVLLPEDQQKEDEGW